MSSRWDRTLSHLVYDFIKAGNATLHFSFFFCLQLDKLKNMLPFDQMTIEDLNEAFPETKLDKIKYPYWPHKPIADL